MVVLHLVLEKVVIVVDVVEQVMMEQGQGRLAGIVFIFLARVLHHWSAKLHHDGVNVVHNKHQSIVLPGLAEQYG